MMYRFLPRMVAHNSVGKIKRIENVAVLARPCDDKQESGADVATFIRLARFRDKVDYRRIRATPYDDRFRRRGLEQAPTDSAASSSKTRFAIMTPL